MKIVVLYPYNFGSGNFEEVFWGIPSKGLLGRGPTALREFLQSEAEYLLIGGGAAIVKDDRGMMRPESYTEYRILRKRLAMLASFGFSQAEITRLHNVFLGGECVVVASVQGSNTETVAAWTRASFDALDRGESRNEIIVVADYAHLRAWNCTVAAFEDLIPRARVIFVPSDVPYAGEPGDAGIAEADILEQPGARDEFFQFIARYKSEAVTATVGRIQGDK